MRWLATALATVALIEASAHAQSDSVGIEEGHELARQVCTECHLVEKNETDDVSYPATAFQDLADSPATTELSLRVFLNTPHRDMPNFVLTQTHADNVIAYILSLR
jgi:mono/diheme cytochrome c family protein